MPPKTDNILIEEFLSTFNNAKSMSTYKTTLKKICEGGLNPEVLLHLNDLDLFSYIVELRPNSLKSVSNYKSTLMQYAKYRQNTDALERLNRLDRISILEQCEALGYIRPQFVSHDRFMHITNAIRNSSTRNALFIASLLQVIYYGIYNEDMSVITNLRASDINLANAQVMVHCDNGDIYPLPLPTELARDLISLSTIQTEERNNRFGPFEMPIEGRYSDSCFKLEARTTGENHQYSYLSRIREVLPEFLGYDMDPRDIYLSGIMNQVKKNLKNEGITLEEAFAPHSRVGTSIIKDTLNFYHSPLVKEKNPVRYLRQHLAGHLSEFKSEDETRKKTDVPAENILYQLATEHSQHPRTIYTVTTEQVYRDPYIAEIAKKRAKGNCTLCGNPAPFADLHGNPYLESHHITWLSEGGKDSLDNVVALCPNCHRKMHILKGTEEEKRNRIYLTQCVAEMLG